MTNGYASREHLDLIGPYLDAWRVDLKGFSRTTYKRISGIAREIGERTPWHLTRFFPSADLAHLPATRVSALERAREIGLEEGLA